MRSRRRRGARSRWQERIGDARLLELMRCGVHAGGNSDLDSQGCKPRLTQNFSCSHWYHIAVSASRRRSSMAAPVSSLTGDLPVPRTRLIGREAERATARTLLLEEAVPLLTLTGPGGVGKTRLALAIAQDVTARFADGMAWVDLAPLRDPALLSSTVAAALGLTPSAGSSVQEQLAGYLRARQTLLLLDNCEHVLDEIAELVGYLLSRSPAIQVLATSRARLHVRGEQVLPVEPLPVPASATLSRGGGCAERSNSPLCRARSRGAPVLALNRRAMPRRSRRSAGSSMACRWRSSWQRRASRCCRWRICWHS